MLNVHIKYHFCYIFFKLLQIIIFANSIYKTELKLGLYDTFNQVFIIIWKVLQYPNVKCIHLYCFFYTRMKLVGEIQLIPSGQCTVCNKFDRHTLSTLSKRTEH